MVSLMDLQMEIVRKFEKFRKNYKKYVSEIRDLAIDVFGKAEVYVFGSVVEGKTHPMSDIDVAVVVDDPSEDKRLELYRKIRERFGMLHPFEIHVLSNEEWKKYSKFIKKFENI